MLTLVMSRGSKPFAIGQGESSSEETLRRIGAEIEDGSKEMLRSMLECQVYTIHLDLGEMPRAGE